ncbi:unnamed protein product [Adineta ricciae]|uniref:Uncharacterized protein n=1 Tax=Adineta ricciae TaxID=249248 RepID=A0A814UCE1_ADIRI|nr:unnamed protein product [Adineta ricciae]
MSSLTIWLCLWSYFVVILAPPSPLKINQTRSLQKITNRSNLNAQTLVEHRKPTTNKTIITSPINLHLFDINTYRSSWKFVDKNTVRVRFRLHEILISLVTESRFIVRHVHTDHIQMYEKPHEIINSTFTLYLHNIKHGRHTVCLLLYTLKFVRTPKYTFCQDIIFNFQKYGHHDTDSDEYGNTFFFLLTQYSIVIGILCILQLVHTGRKHRFLKLVNAKANALRNVMTESYRRSPENKSSRDNGNIRTNALECLIYNLNRNVLFNLDQMYMQTGNEDDEENTNNSLPIIDEKRTKRGTFLKIPDHTDEYSKSSLHRRSVTRTTNDLDSDSDENSGEGESDSRSDNEQSTSFKTLSHILEDNKPWLSRLTDDGNIQHSILSTQSSQRPTFV